jgi:prophage endopeptidase
MIPLNLLLNPKVLGAIFALVLAVGIFGAGYRQGEKHTQADWDKEKTATATKLAAAAQNALALQQEHTNKLAEVDSVYQARLKQKDDEKSAAVAAAYSRGLYVHGAKPTTPNSAPAAPTASSPGVCDATANARLSDSDANFLLSLASDADKVVEQLTACQKIVRDDRQEAAK